MYVCVHLCVCMIHVLFNFGLNLSCPTNRLSKLIDILLQPFLNKIKSYIRENIDFLNSIPEKLIPTHSYCHTMYGTYIVCICVYGIYIVPYMFSDERIKQETYMYVRTK